VRAAAACELGDRAEGEDVEGVWWGNQLSGAACRGLGACCQRYANAAAGDEARRPGGRKTPLCSSRTSLWSCSARCSLRRATSTDHVGTRQYWCNLLEGRAVSRAFPLSGWVPRPWRRTTHLLPKTPPAAHGVDRGAAHPGRQEAEARPHRQGPGLAHLRPPRLAARGGGWLERHRCAERAGE